MKNTITEVKIILEGISNTLVNTEEQITNQIDIIVEITLSE